jgi:hypothetical protein
MPISVTTNPELRQRRWLKRIATLVPQMLDKAGKESDIVVANLGQKKLADGRVVTFMLEAKLVQQDAGGAHQGR